MDARDSFNPTTALQDELDQLDNLENDILAALWITTEKIDEWHAIMERINGFTENYDEIRTASVKIKRAAQTLDDFWSN